MALEHEALTERIIGAEQRSKCTGASGRVFWNRSTRKP